MLRSENISLERIQWSAQQEKLLSDMCLEICEDEVIFSIKAFLVVTYMQGSEYVVACEYFVYCGFHVRYFVKFISYFHINNNKQGLTSMCKLFVLNLFLLS